MCDSNYIFDGIPARGADMAGTAFSGFTGFSSNDHDASTRHFCKLFEDMIVKDVCALRRKELNNSRRFSCDGCDQDIVPSPPAQA